MFTSSATSGSGEAKVSSYDDVHSATVPRCCVLGQYTWRSILMNYVKRRGSGRRARMELNLHQLGGVSLLAK